MNSKLQKSRLIGFIRFREFEPVKVEKKCRENGTLRLLAPPNQMRKMQLSSSGGGECATADGRAEKVTRGSAEKSIRLTRHRGAGKTENWVETCAGVTGWVALSGEIAQQGIAAQQASDKNVWRGSRFEQHRKAG